MTRLTDRLVSGGLIVLVGVLLLLTTTDVLTSASVWAWFPALFVVLGLWALVTSGFRNLTGPVMVVAVAGAFLLRNLAVITDETIGTYWPLFVVLLGVLILAGRSRRERRAGVAGTSASQFSTVGIFGGGTRRIQSDAFTGGDVLALFGGAEVDLRDATVASPPAVVEVLALFGGAELRVPRDWDVDVQVLAIFGGADDDRRRPADRSADADARPTDGGSVAGEPDLVVTGLALFGGVEIVD